MDVLQYNELDITRVKKQYEKVVAYLQADDFYSADVKKLTGSHYYRAKLDYANRVLFKVIAYQGRAYALMLEIIHNHAYEKSRFLNGARVEDDKVACIEKDHFQNLSEEGVVYINIKNKQFHLLDKIISFDDVQDDIFALTPPIIIVGSAGSGKTMLTLEKMKACAGEVLYITGSPYLVKSARSLYYANGYHNEEQEIDFLSYREFLETIEVPEGKEINFPIFSRWTREIKQNKHFQDPNKLYEEFKGVLTGNTIAKRYLSRTEYLDLGIKQSIYSAEERGKVYDLFEQYLRFLQTNNLYDTNMLSFEYLEQCAAKYDFVVVDEVQDFTPIQLALILKAMKSSHHFILCGDSNQIVHPNFFSWARIKSFFYNKNANHSSEIIRILHKNYRNAPAVTKIANRILKAKTARFGSVDKESHYLVESQSATQGEVYCLFENEAIRQEVNSKTAKSTHFAVIVLRDDQKESASRYFQTPLVFSIHEAKGLEYENVILYNFISSDEQRFKEIAEGLTPEDLEGDFIYGRVKDKSDRSLEIYKFYINALYVAITRAIKNVYFIEKTQQHDLLSLLGLQFTAEFIAMETKESSLEDWQQEAMRLELQGKQEQADAIRETILKIKKVPWSVITPELLTELKTKAFTQAHKSKEAKLSLFEYAVYYHDKVLMETLAETGFAPALKNKRDLDLLERKYFMAYRSSNLTTILQQTVSYGIDFRTVFNQTPLMVASVFGNTALVASLVEKGANLEATDNFGRNAFQIALHQAFTEKKFAQEKISKLYAYLAPTSLSLQVDHQLIKIDARLMEFFMFNTIIATLKKNLTPGRLHAFTSDSFLNITPYFPEAIMPERRKRRAYISSMLSKNEVFRQDPYNRKLFLRVCRGHYLLNPYLLIKINDTWVDVYSMLGLPEIKKYCETVYQEEKKAQEEFP